MLCRRYNHVFTVFNIFISTYVKTFYHLQPTQHRIVLTKTEERLKNLSKKLH